MKNNEEKEGAAKDSHSWAYTRLGKITDKTPEEMSNLLGNGDVTITLTVN